jgi:hypothetical protein
VGDEYFALLFRKFIQGLIELFEQHTARVGSLRSSFPRREQVFPCQLLSVLSDYQWVVGQRHRLFFAETIRDPIPSHLEQPGANLFDRFQQPVRLHELIEDVLENVLSVSFVGHPFPDEVPQPNLLQLDYFRDTLVLLSDHWLYARPLHLIL